MAEAVEVSFVCSECDKPFKSKSAHTHHMRYVHEGKKIKKRRTPRSNAPSYGGSRPPSGDWKDRFLKAFARSHMVTEACRAAGVSRAHFYKSKAKDLEFAMQYEDLLERDTEILERIATTRAAEGSDALMMFLLKSRRPTIYRENVNHEHSVMVTGHISVGLLNGHEPIEFAAAKRREAAALLLEGEDIPDVDVVDEEEAA